MTDLLWCAQSAFLTSAQPLPQCWPLEHASCTPACHLCFSARRLHAWRHTRTAVAGRVPQGGEAHRLLPHQLHACAPSPQLVRIYRKVENPIAFSRSPLERKLTTGYLHARYAWLLLAPLQLSGGPLPWACRQKAGAGAVDSQDAGTSSETTILASCFTITHPAQPHDMLATPLNLPDPAADWSYACIEYVSTLSDPRNLGTVALYLALLWLGLAARPWEVLLEWAGRAPAVRKASA